MEENGREELIKLCEDASIVRMTPAGADIRIEVSAWSAVICEIMLLGQRNGNTDSAVDMADEAETTDTADASDAQDVNDMADSEQCVDGNLDVLSGRCFAEVLSLEILQDERDGYRLTIYNLDEDTKQEIVFEAITMRCEPCNALCERIEDYTRLQTPWEYLGLVARGICCHIDYGVANAAEMEVHDLAEFLEELQGSWESVENLMHTETEVDSERVAETESAKPQEESLPGIPYIFENAAKEYGVFAIVEKYASDYGKLFRELAKGKYEPFWRRLYGLLAVTQEGIPSHAQRCCREEDLRAHRQLVTKRMKEQGFEGEYPCFYSQGSGKSPCLFFSYERMHLILHKQTEKSFVFCREQDAEGVVESEFFCGVKFAPGREDDVFSCMFDNDGGSYFSCFTTVSSPEESGGDGVGRSVAMTTTVACTAAGKSARLCRLSREEYAYKHTAAVWSSGGFYIIYFIASLVMFGAFMTVGFMALEAVLVMLFTQSAADVAECFCCTPWGPIFWAAGILYALPMTVCTFLAMRK